MLRPFSLLRRSTAVGAAIALLMLIGAAAAQADFTATAGEQFSGVVDSPGCSPAPTTASPMIDWGDGTPPRPGHTPTASGSGTDSVSGTHTYAAKGTFTVTITVQHCAGGDQTTDTQTATVCAAPLFTQCPPVGVELRLPVPDHGHEQRQLRPAGPQPGAVRGRRRRAHRRRQQLVVADLAHAAVGARARICSASTATESAIPAAGRCHPAAYAPGARHRACDRRSGICSFPKPPGRARRIHGARSADRRHTEWLRGSDHVVLERQARTPAASRPQVRSTSRPRCFLGNRRTSASRNRRPTRSASGRRRPAAQPHHPRWVRARLRSRAR